MAPKRRSLDPSAWAIKYFTALSVSWWFEEKIMSGINESMLSSSAIQIMSQWEAERAIIVLKNRVRENREMKGYEDIRIREESNLSNKS